jgi:hypothetical protein
MKFSASCKFFFLLFFLLLIRSWSGYSLPHTHGLKIYVNKTCDMMEKIRVLHAMTVVLYFHEGILILASCLSTTTCVSIICCILI